MLHDPNRPFNGSVNRKRSLIARAMASGSRIAMNAWAPAKGFRVNRKGWEQLAGLLRRAATSAQRRFQILKYKSKRRMRRARSALQRAFGERRRKAEELREFMPTPSRPQLLALEPRIVFDAAAAATAETAADQVAEQQAADAEQAETGASNDEPSEAQDLTGLTGGESDTNEIAFVDSTVDDVAQLIAGIGPGIEIVFLDPSKDGVEQIASALEGRSNLDAIHIISHGDAGSLYLGNTKLTEASMTGEHADEMAIIAGALSESADILIYGCDFGADARGASAVALLADLTGADIAASNDDTGAAALGGDWDLEVSTGEIEAAALNVENWDHLLAPPSIDLNGAADGINNNVNFTSVSGAVDVVEQAAIIDDLGEQDILRLTIFPEAFSFSDGVNEVLTIGGQTFSMDNTSQSETIQVGSTEFLITQLSANNVIIVTQSDSSAFTTSELGDLQTLVQSITYENTSGTPTENGLRVLDFSVADTEGLNSSIARATITVNNNTNGQN